MADQATDWIEWAGGECPVPINTRVDAVQAGGERVANVLAGSYAAGRWSREWRGSVRDIIRYRRAPGA